ncbi:hypothetical protein RclHR1_26380002 [Rhizophagus clarus]|uniref:Crinkler effector protein N-terminal domain-containing protein n=1 Tax=Rhizophagus clarus TaxID=94130 RepID=A0A2Z6R0X1_9GLOM|nr:hypothetical protein RclHR1_26380002 [Rhizophagus clarus]
MSIVENYLCQNALASYLSERKDKSSYRGFLVQYRDVVISSSPSSNNWKDLDNAWATHFLEEADRLDLDQYEKVKSERSEQWLTTFWKGIVREIGERNKENQVPASPAEPERKRKAVEELPILIKKRWAVITVWCLVHGDLLADAFPVDIEASKTIGHLKDAIRKKINAPESVKAKDLELWRVNVPFEEAEGTAITLDVIETKRKLTIPAIKIYGVFDDKISEFNVHFVVKVPDTTSKY